MALNKLTLKQVRTLGDGLHSDGGNLYLRVRGNSRSWIFRYRFDGNLTDLGLGSVLRVPLSKAREKAQGIREELGNGIDPSLHKKRVARERKRQSALAKPHYIEDFMRDAIQHRIQLKQLRTKGYEARCIYALNQYVLPSLQRMPIQDITKNDVFTLLKPLWTDHPSTASLVLTSLRACFSYAILQGWYEGQPPTDWKNCLDAMLPKLKMGREHRAAVQWKDIPDLYVNLLAEPRSSSRVKDLVLCLLFTATRRDELRMLKACDIDLEKRVFYVRNRKDGKPEPFVVPIPTQAMPIFEHAASNSMLAFGSGTPVSSSTLVCFMKKVAKDKRATIHGLRSSFSTWCADNGKDPVLRELCLCHTVDGAVASAYQRSNLLEPRRKLLQEWADWVTSQTPASGTPC